MRQIEGDALVQLNRILGIGGAQNLPPTMLDDGNLSQVMDVVAVVRRSRTLGPTGGWYHGLFSNAHAANGALTSELDPYIPGAAATAGFPASVARGYDIWLVGAAVNRSAGDAALDGAALGIDPTNPQQAFGINNAGAQVAGSGIIPFAFWDALNTSIAAGLLPPAETIANLVYQPISVRWPRGGANMRFVSDVSGLTTATTINCSVLLGVFPEGLGQDISF